MSTNRPSRRVLVVDDDPVIRQLVSSLIEKEGYMAVMVEDGGAAYRRLQNDTDFCGAILDVNMSHIEGLDLVRFMRTEKRFRRIPVLITTSNKDLGTMANSFAAGAALFLTKPFSKELFQSTFRLLINSHLAALQSRPSPQSRNLPDTR
jgi:CheY-like chemotaxis protein